MGADRRFGDRWWQVLALAVIGLTLFAIPSWPNDAVTRWVGLGAPILFVPLLRRIAAVVPRIPALASAWWATFASLIAFVLIMALAQGVRTRTWSGAWHGVLDLLPVMVVFALMAALPAPPPAEGSITRRRGRLSALLSAAFVIGIIVGYVAGIPDAQQVLAGATWLWRPTIVSALVTWVALGGLFYLNWRSRPAA